MVKISLLYISDGTTLSNIEWKWLEHHFFYHQLNSNMYISQNIFHCKVQRSVQVWKEWIRSCGSLKHFTALQHVLKECVYLHAVHLKNDKTKKNFDAKVFDCLENKMVQIWYTYVSLCIQKLVFSSKHATVGTLNRFIWPYSS